MKIAFIGTGTMGQPMLGNLVKKGFRAVAFDVASTALEAAVRLGAERAGSAAETAAAAEAFGVDPQILTNVIAKSSGATWVMGNMHPVPGIRRDCCVEPAIRAGLHDRLDGEGSRTGGQCRSGIARSAGLANRLPPRALAGGAGRGPRATAARTRG